MQPFGYRSVRYWSKEIDGTLTEGQKVIFLIRGDDASNEGDRLRGHRELRRAVDRLSVGLMSFFVERSASAASSAGGAASGIALLAIVT